MTKYNMRCIYLGFTKYKLRYIYIRFNFNEKWVIFGATFPLFDAKDKSLPVIFVHMTPQGIATWNKLLAILTIVSR